MGIEKIEGKVQNKHNCDTGFGASRLVRVPSRGNHPLN